MSFFYPWYAGYIWGVPFGIMYTWQYYTMTAAQTLLLYPLQMLQLIMMLPILSMLGKWFGTWLGR